MNNIPLQVKFLFKTKSLFFIILCIIGFMPVPVCQVQASSYETELLGPKEIPYNIHWNTSQGKILADFDAIAEKYYIQIFQNSECISYESFTVSSLGTNESASVFDMSIQNPGDYTCRIAAFSKDLYPVKFLEDGSVDVTNSNPELEEALIGFSDMSDVLSYTGPKLDTPANIRVTEIENGIVIAWDPVEKATKYFVKLSSHGEMVWRGVFATGGANSVSITGFTDSPYPNLLDGMEYTITVQAMPADYTENTKSDFSEEYKYVCDYHHYTAESVMYAGTCGDDATFQLVYNPESKKRILKVTGNGTTWDYSTSNMRPWDYYYPEEVEINGNITELGTYFLMGVNISAIHINSPLNKIKEGTFLGLATNTVTLPDTLERIEDWAFYGTSITYLQIPKSVTYISPKAFFAKREDNSEYLPNLFLSVYHDSYAFGYVIERSIRYGVLEPAQMRGFTGTLKDSFELNFYISSCYDQEEVAQNDLYMTFQIGEDIQEVRDYKIVEKNGETMYVFSCKLGICQLKDNIKYKSFYGTISSNYRDVTAMEYLNEILAGTSEEMEDAKPVVNALMNYAGYSQIYFQYHSEDMINQDLYTEATDPVKHFPTEALEELSGYRNSGTDKNADLQYYGSSLVCENNTSLKIYFKILNGDFASVEKKYQCVLAGTDCSYTVTGTDGFYVVTVEKIPAALLDQSISIKIQNKTNAEDQLTLVTSPLNYVRQAISREDNEELSNLCKGLYIYHKKAKKYICK